MTDATLSARELAGRLNLTPHARSWRGECPSCGYYSAFVVKAGEAGRPNLFCASGCPVPDLRDAITRRLGEGWRATPQAAPLDAPERRLARQQAAQRLCSGTVPLAGTAAAIYLGRRQLAAFIGNPALGYRSDVTHPEERGRWAAMVARVVDVDGETIAAHRTYIKPDGNKAGVIPDKASLGPVWGGAVRLGMPLTDPGQPQLVIGEGIESSASAGLIMGLPAWAALSAGNMAKGLQLPPDVRNVVIAADHDSRTRDGHYPGQEAASAAACRWRQEGRMVAIATPDHVGQDFNDVLCGQVQHG